jgi:AcrR family transcriptional regulator
VADTTVRDTRQTIVEAAQHVIADLGLRHATTRAIAERAGCAEGTIYRYWTDKHQLFVEIVKAQFPGFTSLCGSLGERAGAGEVAETLEEVARAALAFYRAISPLAYGAVTDPELRAQTLRHFKESGGGPLWTVRAVTGYLADEQRLGRVPASASPEFAARLLLGMCFAHVYLQEAVGAEADLGSDEEVAAAAVRQLMDGLAP